MNYSQLEILLNVAIAMLLGALIGLDREAAEKPAGFRTHILVSGAACMLISLGEVIVQGQIANFGEDLIVMNPIRIIAAIITGISFLGAGTIIRDRSKSQIEGLTTAASLLFASVIGMWVSLSRWITAIGATALVLVTLRLIPWLEDKIHQLKG
jgi:putative Mg2+ transporter-C (MgtC) family protein